jgi:hypothetical protein
MAARLADGRAALPLTRAVTCLGNPSVTVCMKWPRAPRGGCVGAEDLGLISRVLL